jgi:hypothetical protein
MNTIIGIVVTILFVAILTLLFVALRNVGNLPIEERPFQVYPVVFLEGFEDGNYTFFKGDKAWVIGLIDENHVVVSNKHDGYCASDGCEPFKICTVPTSVLIEYDEETNQ